jgi:hypothetical protein
MQAKLSQPGGRPLALMLICLALIWSAGMALAYLTYGEGFLRFLETYLSPDGQLSNPMDALIKLIFAPILPVLFYLLCRGTYRQFSYPPRYIIRYAAYFALHFAVFTLYFRLIFDGGSKEDTLLEWATVYVSLAAAALFLLAGLKGPRFALILAVGWFVFGMEEMSWGQRVLEIESPEFFKAHNYQQELNFHNFLNPLAQYLTLLMNLFLLCFFTWFRRLRLLRGFYANRGVAQIIGVSDRYGLWTIPAVLIFATIFPGPELVEESWAVLGLLLAVLLLRDMNRDPAA